MLEIRSQGVPLMKTPLGKRLTGPDSEDKETDIRQALGSLKTTGKPLGPKGRGGDNPFKTAFGHTGSSRMYLPLRGTTNIKIDGKAAKIPTGVKVRAKNPEVAKMDAHVKASGEFSHDSLGQMQMAAENDDRYVNSRYRVLTKTGKREFKTNEDGIFPPLIDYDHHNHEWAHVGHAEPLSSEEGHPNSFREVTKTESHPKGISHLDFSRALMRNWQRDNGYSVRETPEQEAHLKHVESHPLVQNFLNHQRETDTPPHDYHEENLAVWTHPHTGEKHIVAVDHGFSQEVKDAYKYGRQQYDKHGTMPSGSGSRYDTRTTTGSSGT